MTTRSKPVKKVLVKRCAECGALLDPNERACPCGSHKWERTLNIDFSRFSTALYAYDVREGE